MLTKDAQIKLLEKKVLALETQMLFVIEMIGAPDANTYERQLKKALAKSDKKANAKLINDYSKQYPSN
jgi:hypothetical protein